MEQFTTSPILRRQLAVRRAAAQLCWSWIEYYCNHPLLSDGKCPHWATLGIDASTEGCELTLSQDLKALTPHMLVCVLKPASAGDMTKGRNGTVGEDVPNPASRLLRLQPHRRNLATTVVHKDWWICCSQLEIQTRVYKNQWATGFYGSRLNRQVGRSLLVFWILSLPRVWKYGWTGGDAAVYQMNLIATAPIWQTVSQ